LDRNAKIGEILQADGVTGRLNFALWVVFTAAACDQSARILVAVENTLNIGSS